MDIRKHMKGSVRIAVRGFSRERFLNLLASNGMTAWDIQNGTSELCLSLAADELRRIKPLLRKTGCRFRIISKTGLPFTVYKYRRRGAFAVGIAAFFILLIFMSQFIWLIEIDGNSSVSDAEMLDFFQSFGIYTGMNKHKLDVDLLKNAVTENFPQISWVSITQNGTKLLVKLSENVKNAEILDYSEPCDIISTRECIVSDIIVQNGTPAVRPGDTVKKGDILISSSVDMTDENGLPAALAPVHSTGEVRGRWYGEFRLELPLCRTVKEYTGHCESIYGAEFFGKKIDTSFLKRDKPDGKYDIITKRQQLGFGPDLPLPAVLTKTVMCEYRTKEFALTKQQAEHRAEAMINRYLINEFPKTAEILEKSVEYEHSKDKLTAAVKLLLEDDIGMEAVPAETADASSPTNDDLTEETNGTNKTAN